MRGDYGDLDQCAVVNRVQWMSTPGPGACVNEPPSVDPNNQAVDASAGPSEGRPDGKARRHAPLRRWTPVTEGESRESRAFLAKLLAFPYLCVGTVVFLIWCYVVQLFLGWPFAGLFPNPSDLVDQLSILRLGDGLGWLSADAVLNEGQYWRLLSSTMLHASLLHIVGNCWMLFLFGRNVENGIGRLAFVVIYVGAGAMGALFSLLLVGQESLGASGAVLGMLGATVSFGRRYRASIPKPLRDYFGVDMWAIVIIVALLSLLPMVDWAGHLGGFLWGLALGALWPSRLYSPDPQGLRLFFRVGLAALALACMVSTLTIMGQRSLLLDEHLPDEELRALRYAMQEEGVEKQLEISTRLAETYREHAWVQVIHGTILMQNERWAEAVLQLRDVEDNWPEYVAAEPYFDNDLAWALFQGHPADAAAVAEGLQRVRRNLAADRGNHAMQNTLALGLYVDGQYRQAERALSAAMSAVPPEERGSDVYLDVMIQLAQKRREAALESYQRALASFPEGDFRADAETALIEAGLLERPALLE